MKHTALLINQRVKGLMRKRAQHAAKFAHKVNVDKLRTFERMRLLARGRLIQNKRATKTKAKAKRVYYINLEDRTPVSYTLHMLKEAANMRR